MKTESIAVLESQKDKAEMLIKTGGCRNLRLDSLIDIYRKEIDINFTAKAHELEADESFRLVKKLYERYYEFLKTQSPTT